MKKALIIGGMILTLALAAMDGKACDEGSTTKGLSGYTKEAKILLSEGNAEQALVTATEAAEMFEDSPIAHYYVAKAQDALGNSDKAIEAYEKSLSLHSENFFALNNVGLLYLRKGDFESAREKLEEAVEMDNPESYAFNNLGVAYERLGMLEKAADAYSKAVELDPSHEKAQMSLARVTRTSTPAECSSEKVAVNSPVSE